MKEFLRYIASGSLIVLPEKVQESFQKSFPEAINTEWYKATDGFESIFHDQGIEKIVVFSAEGQIITLEENLSIDAIPENIASSVEGTGKIMNYILVNKSGKITHELIIRDKNWHRFLIEVSSDGLIISKRRL